MCRPIAGSTSTKTRSATSPTRSRPTARSTDCRHGRRHGRNQDTHGVVRGAVERFPPSLFLRETPLTHADPAIAEVRAAGMRADRRTTALACCTADARRSTRNRIRHRPDPRRPRPRQAFALRRGVCQDLAHIFVGGGAPPAFRRATSAATSTATTARRPGRRPRLGRSLRARLGWVAFDPTNGICPPTPTCGSRSGSITGRRAGARLPHRRQRRESLAVKIRIEQARRQSQN